MKFFNILFKKSLARSLAIGFAILSLVPLLTISLISLDTANTSLRQSAFNIMSIKAGQHANSIQLFFKNIITDLEVESNRPANVNFLYKLVDSFIISGETIEDFVGSYEWVKLIDKHTSELQNFRLIYGFHDLFFIDNKGNIHYTLAREDDLGRNLFTGKYRTSRFAKTAQKVLNTGKTEFSDLENYPPSGNIPAGFLIAPLITEQGQKIGLIAVQFSNQQLINLADSVKTVFGYADVYLVGEDLKLRSPGPNKTVNFLEQSVNTEQTRKWVKYNNKHNGEEQTNFEASIYTGLAGNEVLGGYQNIELLGISWAVIAELDADKALVEVKHLKDKVLGMLLLTIIAVILFSLPIIYRIVNPILALSKAVKKVQQGDLKQQIEITANNELGSLAHGFNQMTKNLFDSQQLAANQHWLQEGITQLNDKMRGDQNLDDLCQNVISFLSCYIELPVGAFYLLDNTSNNMTIKLRGSYCFTAHQGFKNEFLLGEGLVGQAALEQKTIILNDFPKNYLAIHSGLGKSQANTLMLIPLIWNDEVLAVLEFASLTLFTERQQQLLEMASSRISIALQTARAREETQQLLIKTQHQAEELQVQEEELRNNNSLLESQSRELKRSENILQKNQTSLEEKNEQLQVQQEELRVANEELEVKADDLKLSHDVVEEKNKELEHAQFQIQQRAKDIELASKYKSEFLANMSHELRTPLNSLLILSKMLADNSSANLTEKQIKFAKTIHDSGNDLLHLINDILDLSKIESGKMEYHQELLICHELVTNIEHKFTPLAKDKGISFKVVVDNAPESFLTDAQKLGQILNNFLSNAIKFTEKGNVVLTIAPSPENMDFNNPALKTANVLQFSVIDSGIGIAKDKHQTIFEAFKQADGSTSRKYGGTGLGLSISMQLSKLLDGEIHIKSEQGSGSTFSLYIPVLLVDSEINNTKNRSNHLLQNSNGTNKKLATGKTTVTQLDNKNLLTKPVQMDRIPNLQNTEIDDDRDNLTQGERSILIIEDDQRFASILADISHQRDFKVLHAIDGESGLYLADYYQPSGIILDIGLPGMDGWQVMKQLKGNSKTRHIPVHFMSAEDIQLDAMKGGAIGFLSKPVKMDAIQNVFKRFENIIERPVKRLLIVEDNKIQQQSLVELIGNGDVETTLADTGKEAQNYLQTEKFDCMILDLGLPDMDGLKLLEIIRSDESLHNLPIVVYTGKELEPQQREILDRYAQSIIIKDSRSPEKLLDDTALFLHRVEDNLPEDRRRIIRMLHDTKALFEQRKVLLVDDDMRNIFALSSVLQDKKMDVLVAKNGIEALSILDDNPDVAIVLMDIMMPKMDGYEAMQKIRQQQRFVNLPVIALTAKAMKEDRKKCIDAGANDYMIKPIEPDKLISLMRVWLYR
ncbi:MAG: response regulator [Pseudomonadota bacterium]